MKGEPKSSRWVVLLLPLLLRSASAEAQGNPEPPGPPRPKIAFEETAVVASGLSPGEKVVWFGVPTL